MGIANRLARLAGIGAALLLLGACTLTSKLPLIDHGEIPAEAVAGRYQLMFASDPDDMRKLPRAKRAQCITPGYLVTPPPEEGHKPGKPVAISYCAYDPDKKEDLPIIEIVREGDRFVARGPDGDAELRFQRKRTGLYLVQMEKGRTEAPGYDYWLFRLLQPNVEMFILQCRDDFPSVVKANEPEPPSDATSNSCEITSLEPIEGELQAYLDKVATGERFPLALLVPAR